MRREHTGEEQTATCAHVRPPFHFCIVLELRYCKWSLWLKNQESCEIIYGSLETKKGLDHRNGFCVLDVFLCFNTLRMTHFWMDLLIREWK